MSRKPTANLDYTSRDYDAFKEILIAHLQQRIPEYTDTSETDAGIVILEGLANGLDILSFYLDILANDVLMVTTQDRNIAILIARILGYTPYNQTTSITKQVFVLNEVKDIDVIIPIGTIVTTVSENEDITPLQFQTTEYLTIPAGNLGNEQDENGNYLYTVDVAQGESITDDVVGTSNGSSYQMFDLSYDNVLMDTLRVFVQTDDGVEEWTRVDSFLRADLDENSKVYFAIVDEYGKCTIEFGNNIRGKIPPIVEDGISCDYRIGGGTISNVAANVITGLDEIDLEYIEETFNPEASYVKGHDMESLEEIKVNAPASFRVSDRCITLKDYEDILMIQNTDLYPIWRVQAVRDSRDALKANLYIQMRPDYEYSYELVENIENYLEDRIIIGTKYSISPCVYDELELTGSLIVNQDYYKEEVQEEVENFISSYFDDVENFTFDDTFTNSELEQLIRVSVDGVEAFRLNRPSSIRTEPSTPEAILALGSIDLYVTGGKVDE